MGGKRALAFHTKFTERKRRMAAPRSGPHSPLNLAAVTHKLARQSCRQVRKKHGKRALAFHTKFTERKSRMAQCHLQLSEKDMTELRTELTEEVTEPSADRAAPAEELPTRLHDYLCF